MIVKMIRRVPAFPSSTALNGHLVFNRAASALGLHAAVISDVTSFDSDLMCVYLCHGIPRLDYGRAAFHSHAMAWEVEDWVKMVNLRCKFVDIVDTAQIPVGVNGGLALFPLPADLATALGRQREALHDSLRRVLASTLLRPDDLVLSEHVRTLFMPAPELPALHCLMDAHISLRRSFACMLDAECRYTHYVVVTAQGSSEDLACAAAVAFAEPEVSCTQAAYRVGDCVVNVYNIVARAGTLVAKAIHKAFLRRKLQQEENHDVSGLVCRRGR